MAETPPADLPGSPPLDGGAPAVEAAYRSLYRRYRPQRFDEVKGQDHVTVALRNAVRDGRVTHAYLFSGPRGTGKTSTARILARALNCAAPGGGEPCGSCASCRSITAGTSFDVHELDAASTNGVEAMRDLVARAALATPGRWKVYIVDEVHMLSTAASNALLKTLEEPPDHVVFVLATTDPQKVLATIRSRTQHYEFHLLPDDVLEPLLAGVATAAELDLPEGAFSAALRQGRGSARDALSALDQVAAGGVVTDEEGSLAPLVAALAARDVAGALTALDVALSSGRDAQQLVVDLVARLRRAFFLLVAPGLRPPGSLAPGAEEAEVARELGTARIVRAMEVLGATVVAMRDAPEPRISLEVALVRLAHPEADDSPAALLERLERLERRLAGAPAGGPQGAPIPAQAPAPIPAPPPAPSLPPPGGDPVQAASLDQAAPAEASAPGGRPALGAFRAGRARPSEAAAPPPAERPVVDAPASPSGSPASPSREELVAAWGDQVLVGLRPKVRAIFQAGRFVAGGPGGASFALPNEAHLVHAEPLRGEVADALARHFGGPVALGLVVDQGAGAPATPADEGGGSAAGGEDEAEGLEVHDAPAADDRPGEPASPPGGISWAEDRLRRAFPGAEEV